MSSGIQYQCLYKILIPEGVVSSSGKIFLNNVSTSLVVVDSVKRLSSSQKSSASPWHGRRWSRDHQVFPIEKCKRMTLLVGRQVPHQLQHTYLINTVYPASDQTSYQKVASEATAQCAPLSSSHIEHRTVSNLAPMACLMSMPIASKPRP